MNSTFCVANDDRQAQNSYQIVFMSALMISFAAISPSAIPTDACNYVVAEFGGITIGYGLYNDNLFGAIAFNHALVAHTVLAIRPRESDCAGLEKTRFFMCSLPKTSPWWTTDTETNISI
jgi:hypothetical protein